MMIESAEGEYNFDIENPPLNPLTGEPIACWYKPGQTWTGQFGGLATTVDECRAELVGAYLMHDPELLELFGFTETSEIRGDDCKWWSPVTQRMANKHRQYSTTYTSS
jgi:dipeptidyl-peptidase-3